MSDYKWVNVFAVPFVMKSQTKCPFDDGSYQVQYTYNADSLTCTGAASSIATVITVDGLGQITINSCYNGPNNYRTLSKIRHLTCFVHLFLGISK